MFVEVQQSGMWTGAAGSMNSRSSASGVVRSSTPFSLRSRLSASEIACPRRVPTPALSIVILLYRGLSRKTWRVEMSIQISWSFEYCAVATK